MITDMNLIVLLKMGKSRFCLAIVAPLHAKRGYINSNLAFCSRLKHFRSLCMASS